MRDEIIVDRATINSARNRYDTLKKEAGDLEVQSATLSESNRTLIGMQGR